MEKSERDASSIDLDGDSSVDEEIGLLSRVKHTRNLSDRFEGLTESLQWLRDADLVKGILLTTLFVALWHFFSLSISIVSDARAADKSEARSIILITDSSITNGCFQATKSSFLSHYS